jgi:hypothetical protein
MPGSSSILLGSRKHSGFRRSLQIEFKNVVHSKEILAHFGETLAHSGVHPFYPVCGIGVEWNPPKVL